MDLTLPTSAAQHRSERVEPRPSWRTGHTAVCHARPSRRGRPPLARYTDRLGRPREIIVRRGLAGSVLVVDRDAISHGDCLLVAHLGADEPPENAAVVCEVYLSDVRSRRCRCRSFTEQDTQAMPAVEPPAWSSVASHPANPGELLDARGRSYRLAVVVAGNSKPALRWCQIDPPHGVWLAESLEPVSLRETIAQLESYEPTCSLTQRALAQHADAEVSISTLRTELRRVLESPIVLNRGLREAVLAALQSERVSMSEMAIRCGRVKRDCKGNESGETSWLARRLGLLPESGQDTPTPWIHSDVLALIARQGLAISPREVELQ
jgi:hypothetical protein